MVRTILCVQVRVWTQVREPPVHLLCDARSTPPRVAAICIIEGQLLYSDEAPEPRVLEQFKLRGDNQIASLEILAIAFGTQIEGAATQLCVCAFGMPVSGLSTFAEYLRGRNVVVHSDNTVAEHSVRKGRARTFDHTTLVHAIWYALRQLRLMHTCIHVHMLQEQGVEAGGKYDCEKGSLQGASGLPNILLHVLGTHFLSNLIMA